MRRKKKAQVRARKVKSSGVWIAPDLERKIKGEGGRRGLTEPPYSYYLRLADLALKSSGPAEQPSQPARSAPLFPDPLLRTPPTRSTSDVMQTNVVTHQARRPVPVRPKPPQLTVPKPPKAPQPPKPAKRSQTTPLQRSAPQKLSIPKPPKRPKRG